MDNTYHSGSAVKFIASIESALDQVSFSAGNITWADNDVLVHVRFRDVEMHFCRWRLAIDRLLTLFC